MSATIETASPGQDIGSDGGFSASSPLLILVFGFVFVILLQAWFVRRITQLTARHQERKAAHRKLGEEAAELADEVTGLDRANESNVASIAGLEREIQELQERIAAFTAEHGAKILAPAASTSTDEDGGEDEAQIAASGDLEESAEAVEPKDATGGP